MKCLVLLAGCGLGDGSCIEEVVLTYAALDRYGCDYTPVAENIFVPSVNHLTERPAEKRNVLWEAARIGRGRIKDIGEIDFEEYDALIIPGGIGLLSHYRDSDVIETCITHFIGKKKPIAAMCAGIDFVRRFLGSDLLARETKGLTAEEFCFDADRNIYYTPAFRKTGSCYTALLGIDSMICALKQAQTA
jgi:enhancing lycopene biosynthesis protein 2